MSYKQKSPVPVVEGGTGTTSFSVTYAVITGGLTDTGALQTIASVGTATHVLTSNGAALPTFQVAPTSSSNVVFEPVASDPGIPDEGDIWFNTTSNSFKGYTTTTVTFTVT